MNRIRPNTRIRPVRPYWSRTKLLTVVGVSVVILSLAATAWLQRTEDRLVDLGPSGPYRVRSTAGPVTISNGDDPALRYQASWLLRGPSLTGDGADDVFPNDIVLRCNTRFPCRAGANVDVPSAEELVVEAVGNDVFVDHFDGTLSVDAAGDGDVVLGPVAGVVTVSTEDGSIIGSGLTAKEVELDTRSGEVDVWFGTRPDVVTIRSGSEPVTLRLPDGDYAVSVKSGSSIIVTVGQVATADSVILVQARGPVRIEPTK